MFAKTLIASLLVTSVSAVSASEYFVVVPLPAKQAALNNISVSLRPVPLPEGVVGVAYSGFDLNSALAVTGDAAYTPGSVGWRIVAGSIPPGMSLNQGVLSGTPTQAGAETFTVRATYKTRTGEQAYRIVSVAVNVGLAAAALPESRAGSAYSYDFRQLASVGGDPNYDASLLIFREAQGSAVPAGLNLSAGGMLSGAPALENPGATFSVVATYRGKEASRQYSLPVLPAFFVFNHTVAGSTTRYVLRDAALSAGWDGVRPLKATVTIPPGVYVGSTSTAAYAFDTGAGFPSGSVLALNNYGTVVGMGGAGGSAAYAGAAGGPALRAQYALTIANDGTIAGGGGGGAGSNTATKSNVLAGGAGGGGGQGYGASAGGARAGTYAGAEYPSAQPGAAGGIASPGAGGAGVSSGYYPNQFSAPWYAASGAGGAGGALGQPGAASEAGWGETGVTGVYSNPGGAAGYAVVGSNNVTWVPKGEVLGPTQ
jgi:hypothetical protein